ncbi:hypothetical protein [Streptomyces niveus]
MTVEAINIVPAIRACWGSVPLTAAARVFQVSAPEHARRVVATVGRD